MSHPPAPAGRSSAATPSSRTALRRYVVAAAAVALSLTARLALSPALRATDMPFTLYYPAVAVAAWYGGFGPGLFAIVLASAAADFFSFAPTNSFALDDPIAFAAFPVASLCVVGAIELLHRARGETARVADVLSTTLASIGDGVIVTDAQGRVTFENAEAERLTGVPDADARGRPLEDVFRIVNERSRETVENPVAKVLRDGKVVGLANHTVLLARDGRETPIDDSAAPVRRPGGPVMGVVLVFRDVREQRAADATRARLAAIIDSSGDAIVSKSLDGTIQTWNAAAERLFGWSAQEIVGRSILTLIPPEHRDEEDMILGRIRGGRQAELIETTRLTKDGRRIPVSVRVSPVRDAEGAVIGASKIVRDLSDLVAARDALAREKELLATTLSSIGDAVIATDVEGRVTFLNPVARELTGWSEEDAAGRPLPEIFRIVNESTRAEVENPALRAVRFGVVVGLANHTVLVAKDGAEHAIDDSAAPIRARDGDVIGSVLVFRDVGERRRGDAERERLRAQLAATVQELQAVFETVPVQIWLGDASCTRFRGNRRACEEHGLPYDAEPSSDGFAPELPSGFHSEVEGREVPREEMPMRVAARTGRPVHHFEYDAVHPDGRRKTFWANVAPLFAESGAVREVVGSFIDVTTLRAAERALREADQRKNEFIATMAHELRNPLAPIKNSTSILRIKGPRDEELIAARAVIERQVQHLSRLLDDLLDVNRLGRGKLELRKERVSLRSVLDAALETARPGIDAKRHRITFDPIDDVALDADPVRLAQVFGNLLNNAAKYMDDRGQIWVSTRREGGDVVVSVRDAGVGIPAESLPRLFEMYAQTPLALERAQGGVGIGLSLAKGLVELHGGSISAKSDGPGKGSEFVVRLPIAADAAPPPTTPSMNTPTRAHRKAGVTRRVLIADDVRDNADTLAMMLRALGHDVHVAYDGEEAVALAGKTRPEIALLDIGMPGLSGYEACRRIRAEPWGRDVYLIAQTGWGQEEDRRRADEAGFDRHMLKPVDCAELVVVLANLPGGNGKR